ncbi:MAG: hypothetical protein ACHQUB_03735 [Candidatus Saccharimonadia bacterium]
MTLDPRTCKICLQTTPAEDYGGHCLGHGPEVIAAEWPGGVDGFLDDMKASLELSIQESDDHVTIGRLKWALELIRLMRLP